MQPNIAKTRQAAAAALVAFARKEITTAELKEAARQANVETKKLQAGAQRLIDEFNKEDMNDEAN